MDSIEHDDAEGEKHCHEACAVAEGCPAELANPKHGELERLDDAGDGVQLHHEFEFWVLDGR